MLLRQHNLCFFSKCQILVWASLEFVPAAYAEKTNQAVYEVPYDLAAGGASLTRASQEGVMFANPAQMPYGQKFFRWFGSEFALLAAKESYEEAKNLAGGKEKSSGDEQESEEANADFFDKAFDTPIHFGATSAISFISNNFGIGTFARFEPDIAGQRHNETGIPEFRARAEGYAGLAASLAGKVCSWLSLGLTAKHMYKVEPDLVIDLADQNKVNEIRADPAALQNEVTPGFGTSFDAGALVFKQGYNWDYRLALKVDDVGDTSFTEGQRTFKQTYHAGIGVTLHNAIDSLHLALDFRDVTGVYEEPITLRVYAGAKLMLRKFFGLAIGLYQGYPTYGVRLDLLFVKLGFTVYGRELGDYAGDDPRTIYMASLGIGI
jgi:hypothetical protein